LNARTSVT
jgi:hypothetical protein